MKWPLVLGVVLSVVVVGCSAPVETKTERDGSQTTTVKGTDGSQVKINQNGAKAVFTDGKGNTMRAGADKAPDLGTEVMPGFELDKDSVIDTRSEEAHGAVANFKTDKSVAEVEAFYQKALGDKVKISKVSSNGSEMSVLAKEEGKISIMVSISKGKDDNRTAVSIAYNEKLK